MFVYGNGRARFDKSIDFVGGRTYTIRFDQPVSTEEVAASLGDVLVETEKNKSLK